MSPKLSEQGSTVLGAGLTWAISVALLAWLGHLLDGGVSTSPLFLVVGALAGAIGGFFHFLARVAPEMLPFKRTDADDGGRGSASDSEGPRKPE